MDPTMLKQAYRSERLLLDSLMRLKNCSSGGFDGAEGV